jgi:type IV pilus assembly protein PilN
MIRINLLPVKELKAVVGRRRELIVGVLCLATPIALILGVYLYQLRRTSLLEQELASLRNELQVLNVKVRDATEYQNKIKEHQNKHKVLESINKKRSGPVRVMESLSAATPNSLWLTQFKETGGNVTITGVAVDNQTIAEFLKALETYAFFKETELVETIQSEQTGTPPRRFSIKSKLSYQPVTQPALGDKAAPQPTAGKGSQP